MGRFDVELELELELEHRVRTEPVSAKNHAKSDKLTYAICNYGHKTLCRPEFRIETLSIRSRNVSRARSLLPACLPACLPAVRPNIYGFVSIVFYFYLRCHLASPRRTCDARPFTQNQTTRVMLSLRSCPESACMPRTRRNRVMNFIRISIIGDVFSLSSRVTTHHHHTYVCSVHRARHVPMCWHRLRADVDICVGRPRLNVSNDIPRSLRICKFKNIMLRKELSPPHCEQ